MKCRGPSSRWLWMLGPVGADRWLWLARDARSLDPLKMACDVCRVSARACGKSLSRGYRVDFSFRTKSVTVKAKKYFRECNFAGRLGRLRTVDDRIKSRSLPGAACNVLGRARIASMPRDGAIIFSDLTGPSQEVDHGPMTSIGGWFDLAQSRAREAE